MEFQLFSNKLIMSQMIEIMRHLRHSSKRCHPSHESHPYHKNNLFEAKQWTFEETNALMEIWSQIDFNSYETKIIGYKLIQTHLKKYGFDRNLDQIRCKLKRITSKGYDKRLLSEEPSVPQTVNSLKTEDMFNCFTTQDSKDINKTKNEMSFDSESDLNCDIILTDIIDQQSNDGSISHSIFKINCSDGSSDGSREPETTLKTLNSKHLEKEFFDGIADVRHESDICFNQIMSGQQQIQQSILQFNKELTRFADLVLNHNDIDLNVDNFETNFRHSLNQSSHPSLKIVIPNLNKKFSIDFDNK